jgi:hypothetical protein
MPDANKPVSDIEDSALPLEDDPVLGAAIANYPSNRARLLLIGAAILGVAYLILTITLLNVEERLAFGITVVVMGIVTIAVGWYMAHLWNREVVLYDKGFSYREGSFIAYIPYADILAMRQLAERRAYFGGLLRRNVYRYTLLTLQDETIVLGNVYKRIDELGVRLERAVNDALRGVMERALAAGKTVPFSATLSIGTDGLHEGERLLQWSDFGGYQIARGSLDVLAKSDKAVWFSVPLDEIDNVTLLLGVLKEKS